ncbi:hypothetical protein PVAP13_5KG008012 [Panicum virgatum]|uniref:Uncharacterized protein n=1 Tax=Panicum virgatum TaxID=38727 RepID=A0A8T0SCY6_PANVG|nr:hypothetical protein PVAP13_5KG008012 [Panicum virgatum]
MLVSETYIMTLLIDGSFVCWSYQLPYMRTICLFSF